MRQKKDKKQISKWVLGIGIITTFVFPAIVFLFDLPGDTLGLTGLLGDTIGGITSPVLSLVGSVLLYIALTDQIEANNLLSVQIEEAKQDSKIQRELEHISELYHLFERSIESFPYEDKQFDEAGRRGYATVYKGTIALTHFVDHLLVSDADPHDDHMHGADTGVKEFRSIIKSAELLIDRISNSHVTPEDKRFYKNLILHRISYNLSPDFERIPADRRMGIRCKICGEDHGSFPVILFNSIEELKTKIEALDVDTQN